MIRRDFLAALAASVILPSLPLFAQSSTQRPRLLIADTDPFTGLHILKSRYAAGRRPSEDMEGWALSWRLTGLESFAERALAEIRAKHIAKGGKASRGWVDYVRWSLAFDWLFDFRGFDRDLQNRVAQELWGGASAMLATADFADPANYSYHNYSVRYLALAAFASAAVQGHHVCDEKCKAGRDQATKCLENVLDITSLVSPDGSYHESMDYMRITWASLVLLAELQRTTTGIDPAQNFPAFRNIGDTYLYKLLPDGTPSREGDNEYPILDSRDTTLIGYAVNRFKDPYSAWLLRNSGFFPKQWVLPVLEFLWDDQEVTPRDPALADEHELSRQRYFAGVGHLVIRDGWKKDSTWIEFDCGPYFAKHQHLGQNHFTIYHGGYLAIDSGADYTDTESPHYLNYYRRTVAHNSVLVYDPAEKFFWSDNVVPAANDGGQRMDSSRYWNTIRSEADWDRTRDLWNTGQMRVVDHVPGQYHYAMGDATDAYSKEKLWCFTRELVYVPGQNLLFVYDRVVSTNPSFRKAWLLHGVNQPSVDEDSGEETKGSKDFRNAKAFRFREGSGELMVHSLLPKDRIVTRQGGPGNEFYTPGDDLGGGWGTGENWPLEPTEGAPLPGNPKLRAMWKKFWGDDFDKILPSNRKNVIPGSWRIEVSPSIPAEEDKFLHLFEIGDHGSTGKSHAGLIDGANLQGAAFEHGPIVLFGSGGSGLSRGEASLPDLQSTSLIITGLQPNSAYELNFGGLNVSSAANPVLPGVSAGTVRAASNSKGVLHIERNELSNLRLRIERI